MQPEARLRARCAKFLKSHLPAPCYFTAIEHGRQHHGTPEQRAREWQRLAAQGVQQGIGDMLVMAPGYVLWLELKAGKNNATDAQSAFGEAMTRLGHGYALVRSVEHLGATMEAHGIPLSPGWRVAAQIHDAALDAVAPYVPKKPAKPPRLKPTRAQIGRANRMQLAMARGKP